MDIAWEGLRFTYNSAFEGNWHPQTHEYDNSTAAGSAVVGTITVTPTGSLPEGTEGATIGTITITIS